MSLYFPELKDTSLNALFWGDLGVLNAYPLSCFPTFPNPTFQSV